MDMSRLIDEVNSLKSNVYKIDPLKGDIESINDYLKRFNARLHDIEASITKLIEHVNKLINRQPKEMLCYSCMGEGRVLSSITYAPQRRLCDYCKGKGKVYE